MRALRLFLAGLLAVMALVAGFFAAAVILVTGLVGYAVQLITRRPGSVRGRTSRPAGRPGPHRTDDVIDVVTTKVPAEKIERR